MHVVERFAEFALAFRAQPVPAGVLHHAKRAVIDWHAALLPGAVAAPATLLEKALSQDLDRGGATLALGRKATARTAALTHGSVRLAAFEPERLADAATRALMTRIEVSADAELDAAFPRQRAARVAIETRDGRRGEFLQPTRKGDPDMPLSDGELEQKFLELAAPVLGETAARPLVARLWTLERAPAV